MNNKTEPKELTIVRRHLSKKGADLKALAKKADVTTRTLENIRGDRNSPTVATLMKIYRAIVP